MSGASDNLIRWDMVLGTVDLQTRPPACWFTDFPPLPGESSRDYFNRVNVGVLMAHYSPKPRKWWKFW